jgi:hypothetical protein
MPKIEFYIISQSGLLLYKYSVKENQDGDKDQLLSGLLSAINSVASNIGWSDGVSMIRSGSIEARYSQGHHVLGILILMDYYKSGIADSELALDGFAKQITERFEIVYKNELEEAKQSKRYDTNLFQDFTKHIDEIIKENNTHLAEIYQQQILVQLISANLPEELVLSLMRRLKIGESILDEISCLILEYPIMSKVVEKINKIHEPVWEIFRVPLLKRG